MKSFAISFLGRTLGVEAPGDLGPGIAAFFALTAPPYGCEPTGRARITETAAGRFSLAIEDRPPVGDLTRGEVIAHLASELAVAAPLPADGVALKAAAVGWNDKAILIASPEGAGKSALAAWLVDKGFAYLADDSVVLSPAGQVTGFPGPLAFNPAKLSHVAGLEAFREAASVRAGDRMLICPERTWLATEPSGEVGLIIDVSFAESAPLRLEPLPADAVVLRLLEATRTVVIPGDGEHVPLAALAERAPALKLTYGHFSQFDGVLDFLTRLIIESGSAPADVEKFLRGLPRQAEAPKVYPIPARTERELHPKLTIGMATYDDFDGVYFTLQAIRMYHPEILDEVEFVVVDNHPDGPCAAPLKQLEGAIPNYRYVPYPDAVGTAAAKDRVFREAAGSFVLCMDCHVFIVPGALKRLIDYFDSDRGPGDLLQGPLLYDDLKSISTHLDPQWRTGFFGTWATKSEAYDANAPPFEVELQGLGLFACRKDAWLSFNPQFRGFGGEEGYIHEKFRRAGRRTLCLPFLRWMHRFQRPMGIPYPNIWEERMGNYLIGAQELGQSIGPMRDHFAEVLGAEDADRILSELEGLAAPRHPSS